MKAVFSFVGLVSCALVACLLVGTGASVADAAEPTRDLPEVNADLYAKSPEPMRPVECGRCHVSHYTNLKDAGGKHRFACQECHEQFHSYNPLKDNYAALMPKCSTCHGLPHGEKQTSCAGCHSNPHAPQRVPVVEQLSSICADCHGGPAQMLVQAPSAHTELGCDSCHHDTHGYIPNCFECHDGHTAQQPVDTCANCHQEVHQPLQIALGGATDTQTCAVCHDGVYGKWQATPSKHGAVNCGSCHTRHAYIPNCLDCHAAPHDEAHLRMFPNCLDCHIDVHDLPVKN